MVILNSLNGQDDEFLMLYITAAGTQCTSKWLVEFNTGGRGIHVRCLFRYLLTVSMLYSEDACKLAKNFIC